MEFTAEGTGRTGRGLPEAGERTATRVVEQSCCCEALFISADVNVDSRSPATVLLFWIA